jgi:hypothetical protein
MPYKTDIPGFMEELELQAIEQLARTVPKHGTIVELGSFIGRSSVCWALSAPTTTVYCIDRFKDEWLIYNYDIDDEIGSKLNYPLKHVKYNCKQEFIKNTKEIPNIIRIEGESPNIEYPGPEIDIFFLDAEHVNPSDWDNLCYFVPLIKEGGIVCGHDLYVFEDVNINAKRLESILGTTMVHIPGTTIWMLELPRKITKEELCKYEL